MIKTLFSCLLFLLSSCSSLLYYPSKLNFDQPKRLGLQVDEIYFKTSDFIQLHGWLLHAKEVLKPKGLLLHFHGNAENISTHYTAFAWLTKYGYDVLIFDYRGYGESEGSPSPKGLSLDGEAAVNFAWNLKLKKQYDKFIVAGQSLGGSVVLKTLSLEAQRDKKIDLVILDSTFRSNSAVGASALRKSWITFLFSPLSYLVLNDTYNATNVDLRQWRFPTLCVTHKDDPAVASYLTKDIYENINKSQKKWLWFREDDYPGHINSFYTPDGPLNNKLLNLLEVI